MPLYGPVKFKRDFSLLIQNIGRYMVTLETVATTGVNAAGDAGDTSPPIFWLVGTSMGISPPNFLRRPMLSDIADQH